MWKVAASAFVLVASSMMLPSAAEAKCWHVCWEAVSGTTSCQCLPDNYRLPGIERPQCKPMSCPTPQVDFILTRRNIHALSRYVDTSTMAPLHKAYVHSPL